MGSLVDPSFELIDPCPDVHALFCAFNARFFYSAVDGCEVKWSPRMTTCAGICSYEGRGGLCSIRLSKPLLQLRPRRDLIETLLHEMIHAYLFVTDRDRDRDGHGPKFQMHMHRINAEAGTHISIYHSFHREVALYKTHHWRCEGPCRNRAPFYGWVKRASNRAPSKNDLWWADHERSCGGKFVKVSEPEDYGKKKGKKGGGKENGGSKKDGTGGGGSKGKPLEDRKQPRIDDIFMRVSVFKGSGAVLGGSGTGVSRLVKEAEGTLTSSAVGGGKAVGGGAGRSRLLDLFDQREERAKKQRLEREEERNEDSDIEVLEVKLVGGGSVIQLDVY